MNIDKSEEMNRLFIVGIIDNLLTSSTIVFFRLFRLPFRIVRRLSKRKYSKFFFSSHF